MEPHGLVPNKRKCAEIGGNGDRRTKPPPNSGRCLRLHQSSSLITKPKTTNTTESRPNVTPLNYALRTTASQSEPRRKRNANETAEDGSHRGATVERKVQARRRRRTRLRLFRSPQKLARRRAKRCEYRNHAQDTLPDVSEEAA